MYFHQNNDIHNTGNITIHLLLAAYRGVLKHTGKVYHVIDLTVGKQTDKSTLQLEAQNSY